jgi:hypothetical protein
MHGFAHSLKNLFAQLGLPTEEVEIARFIETHRPLPQGMSLPDAPFWTPSQAGFLREEVLMDADWAAVIDELNVNLHGPH